MEISHKNVMVYKLRHSRNVTKFYRQSLQQYPVGQIDLRGIRNMKSFAIAWQESIDLKGVFTLRARDKKGHIRKTLGKILVTGNGKSIRITIKDNRCSLSSMMRTREAIHEALKEDDFTL